MTLINCTTKFFIVLSNKISFFKALQTLSRAYRKALSKLLPTSLAFAKTKALTQNVEKAELNKKAAHFCLPLSLPYFLEGTVVYMYCILGKLSRYGAVIFITALSLYTP